jgi:hypothetical protein
MLSAGSSEDVRAEGHVKRLAWVGVVVLLVLVTRWLAYALAAPSPLSNRLQASAGGPSLVVVTLVALGLAAGLSVLVVWLASVGVRERQRLQPERVRPELRLPRLALRAVLLYAASSLAFALVESYLHWRAGIGFHGLSCLVGPVHRNAIPLLFALSVSSAAIAAAAEHIVAWMRAVLRALHGDLPIPEPVETLTSFLSLLLAAPSGAVSRPRAPPVPA